MPYNQIEQPQCMGIREIEKVYSKFIRKQNDEQNLQNHENDQKNKLSYEERGNIRIGASLNQFGVNGLKHAKLV